MPPFIVMGSKDSSASSASTVSWSGRSPGHGSCHLRRKKREGRCHDCLWPFIQQLNKTVIWQGPRSVARSFTYLFARHSCPLRTVHSCKIYIPCLIWVADMVVLRHIRNLSAMYNYLPECSHQSGTLSVLTDPDGHYCNLWNFPRLVSHSHNLKKKIKISQGHLLIWHPLHPMVWCHMILSVVMLHCDIMISRCDIRSDLIFW